MRKRYRKPPIVEALVEFRFDPSGNWDLTVPGIMYEQLKGRYPIRRQVQQHDFNLTAGDSKLEGKVQTIERMQFLGEDEHTLIQVSRHFLVVNQLAPYESWESFVPVIKNGLDAYRDVVNPDSLQRVGIRYINHIGFENEQIELEDYFHFRPETGEGLPAQMANFFMRSLFTYEGDRDVLKIELTGPIILKNQPLGVILDLDYILQQPDAITIDEVFSWIDTAHGHIEDGFESCITDKSRILFEEIQS